MHILNDVSQQETKWLTSAHMKPETNEKPASVTKHFPR